MFTAVRRHISYANVAATLALVFSMSGGALAAKHYLISSTKQINPKVLNRLRGRSGARGATGATGSQGAQGKEGPRGVAGLNGVNGANGANGATKVVVRSAQADAESFNTGHAQANCASGERATGGGMQLILGNVEHVFFYEPGGIPVPETTGATPTGWFAEWFNSSPELDGFRVYVICASP
jgi:hypothetical protein